MAKDKKEKKKIKPTKLEKWFNFMHRAVKLLFPFFHFKYYGEKIPFDGGPYIIVGNHHSLLDVIPIALTIKEPVHFIAKNELWKGGLMKKFVVKCECIPVSRDGNDSSALIKSLRYLKNGESVAIFPEGTRNKSDQRFLPFKSGAAAISIMSKRPIVPVVQIRKIRFMRKEYIYYGKPVEFTEFYGKKPTEADIAACDQKLLDEMNAIYEKLTEIVTAKKKRRAK